MSEQTKRVRLYAGVRLRDEWNDQSLELHHTFYEQDENGEIADVFRYAQSDRKDSMNSFVIGGYYDCTINDETKRSQVYGTEDQPGSLYGVGH